MTRSELKMLSRTGAPSNGEVIDAEVEVLQDESFENDSENSGVSPMLLLALGVALFFVLK
jgi:uncharacterized OsmC-like protein